MIDKINITVQHSIIINKPCEEVFDFTQDFSKRMLWDKSIIDCKLISEAPERKAFIKVKGGMTALLVYKVFESPYKTSLRMTEITSSIVIDGGGSWNYEMYDNNSMMWTQTNSISLKNIFISKFVRKFVEKILKRNTITSMERAKYLLEKQIK